MALAAGHEEPGRPVCPVDRPGRPVCTTCTDMIRSWQRNGQSEWSSTDMSQLSVGLIDWAGRPTPDRPRTRVGQSASRPIDAFYSPLGFELLVCFGIESNQGFLNLWDSLVINMGYSLHVLYF